MKTTVVLEKTGRKLQPAASEAFQHEIDLRMLKEHRKKIKYHPMELIYWKYGSFLCMQGDRESRKRGRQYLKNGVELCARYPDYLAMRITGIGIEAEWISGLLADGLPTDVRRGSLIRTIGDILALDLRQDIREYVEDLLREANQGNYAKAAEMATCLRDV